MWKRNAKGVFLSILLGFSFCHLQAQSYGRHPFDAKNFNLGFLMGLNLNSYNLKEQTQVEDEGKILERLELINRPGLTLGMIANFNISSQLSLRIIPSVSLEQRDFTYTFSDGEVQDRKIEASYFNVPVLLQLKSKYYEATRIYVLGGFQFGVNLASNEKVRNDPLLLKIRNEDLSVVIGTGINLYGDRIKLSPEIRYSIGLLNVYEPLYTSHANAIQRLFSQVITLNVNFE
ncbi:MAG: porin family protein [Bacteroidota bacterium]